VLGGASVVLGGASVVLGGASVVLIKCSLPLPPPAGISVPASNLPLRRQLGVKQV